jgi:hypothetical protein
LRGSRHSFSDFAEKIATTRSLATNVNLPAGEWSRRGGRKLSMVELFLENLRANGTVISKKQGGYV